MRDHDAVARAWKVIEQDAQEEHQGSGMGWRDHLAYRLASQEVQATVESVLDELERGVQEGEITTRGELEVRAGEEADNAAIYTLSALVYLLGSSNADAYAEEMGEETEDVSVRAAWAIMAEVQERDRWDALVAHVTD